jgi:hypothetical protein
MSSAEEGATVPELDPRLEGRDRVLAQIELWRRELVNLTRRNRLLNFRPSKSSTLELVVEPDELSSVVEHVLAGKFWRFFEPPEVAEGEERPEQLMPNPGELITDKKDAGALLRTLRTLDRRATQEYMDKGLWILYLAAGLLRWIDPDTKEETSSPLVLVPVALLRDSPRAPYRLAKIDEDSVVNPALVLKLEELGLGVPDLDDPEEPDLDDYFERIRNLIRGRAGWDVQPRLVVSHFSFHKEVMYRDLEANAEQIADHPIVDALVRGSEEGSSLDFESLAEELLDQQGRPKDGATVLPADATQRQCINSSVDGNTFVMDGPPGTGKSQTIANMIAENIALGRTVLFVSEKAAALDVVETRMRQVGLGDYTLELHSHKATRKEVAQELARALSHHPQAGPEMPGGELADLARRRDELSARAAAVNEIREPFGRSLLSVIGRIAQLQDRPQAPHPQALGLTLTPTEFSDIVSTAARLSRAWGPVTRGADFLWRELDNITLTSATRQRVDDQVDEAKRALERLVQSAATIREELGLDGSSEMPAFRRLLHLLQHLQESHDAPQLWLTEVDLTSFESLRDARKELVESRAEAIRSLEREAGESFRELPFERIDEVTANSSYLLSSPIGDAASGLTRVELERLAAGLVDGEHLFDEVARRAKLLFDAFSLSEPSANLDRTWEVSILGTLAASVDKPEAEWLDATKLPTAVHAKETLEALVISFRQLREELGSTFSDDVLDADLAGLIGRFETAHHGLGKLKGGYRADKKAVASVTRSGRFTQDVLELLPRALEWQELRTTLGDAEVQHAAVLGEHYYRGEGTDFDRIHRALEVAQRAINLAGPDCDLRALQRQLGRRAAPGTDVPANGAWVLERVAAWRADADASLTPPLAKALSESSLDHARSAARELQEPARTLEDILTTVDSLVGRAVTVEEAAELLSSRVRLDRLDKQLDATRADDDVRLGAIYAGAETDWESLDAALAWAADLRSLVDSEIDEEVAARLLSSAIPPSELDEPLSQWVVTRDAICGNFASGRREELQQDFMTTVDDAQDLLGALRETLADIEEWFEYSESRSRLLDLGVAEPLEFCESRSLDAQLVPHVVERAVLERWADEIMASDKARISTVRADELSSIVDEFRRLDERVIELAAARVIRACNERRPRTTLGPAGLIQREGMKQRKHMPIRELFSRAGPVVQALKPCVMMTPLTVSQFLPPGFRFDVVIMDEASQVRPSDAVNCIYRGDQLIVAGDEQQLPPTSFFDAAFGDTDDEYDEEDFAEFESILKLCLGAGGLRRLPLKWHYRSHHEDLILYSNHSFYEGRLISYPGAVHAAEDLGVELFHVADGIYRRGTSRDNPREAEVVVDRMMHWAEWSLAHPKNAVTIGVVAFSEAQASAIEAELDRRRQQRFDLDRFFVQDDRLDGYFIKNLENVQGDERDVMIFSIGYGTDENGKFTMSFGPINRAGGYRRLNVAITRARRRVEVVSSVKADQFTHSEREGVRHLQRYLDFAAKGHSALALEISDSGLDIESPFEDEVVRVIRSWGYDAVPQVGAAGYRIDIGVRHPIEFGRYALGIECDGAMYHSSRVARDRDRLRQEVLEGLGWRLHRIWGTSWYRDRQGQEQLLREAIEAAIAGDPPASRKRRFEVQPTWTDAIYEVVSVDERPAWVEQYVVARPKPPSRWIDMHDYGAQSDLRRMIEEVVTVEGPVAREVVLRRVREAWGIGRAGSRIRSSFDEAVKTLRSRGRIIESEKGVLTLDGANAERVRVPDPDDPSTRRTIAEVPVTELRAAILGVVGDAMQAGRDELTFAVARLYGWNRRGSDIGAALERAVTYLLRMKRLVRDGEYLRLP